ncbi:MAG: HD domain-containing protein [Chloroflexota bacterium]
MARVGYRVRQFGRLVWPQPLTVAERQQVAAVLSRRQQLLFYEFAVSDQRHSYRVLQMLLAAGETEPSLLVAALLHDIGKICHPVYVWDRVLIVLGEAFLPRRVAAWGLGEAGGWKRPFVIRAQHPAWGAELVQTAGATPLTVRLVARHQEKLAAPQNDEDRLLARLQWADDRN